MLKKSKKNMLNIQQLKEKVDLGEIDTVITAFPDLYGRLLGKRIDGHFFLDKISEGGMHACNYLFTVDMEMEPIPGYAYANWESGYGDFHCVPDLNTLRVAAWLDRSAIVICDVYEEKTQKLTEISPRSMLKKQLKTATEMGFFPQGASELEYYIFNGTYKDAREKQYAELNKFSAYIEDYHILQCTREEPLNAAARRCLSASGIPVEFSKGEWGPGQHELNIRYADLLEMADRHIIYKQCFKDLADQLGLSVTFMAKVDENLAGSSCHIHLSLWDEAGKNNLMAGDKAIGPIMGSDTFRWFLGGWMAHTAEMMLFYAPTINSYKRFKTGSWAPTGLAWSYDNRTACFRVIGKDKSLRIESRLPGADVNPYLAYAAALASGLDGIQNKTEPQDIFTGDVYSAMDLPHLPLTISEAIDALERSSFAVRSFGKDVVDHYLHFYKTERAMFRNSVTDWEKFRYFEQI
jgi:glutamine synthetase